MIIRQFMLAFVLLSLFMGTARISLAEQQPGTVEPAVAQSACPGAPAPRLSIGGTARVTSGLSNRIRSYPALTSSIIGQIPGGSTFSVMYGPTCASSINWWQVNYNGVIGWTAEGQGTTYWLEPLTCTGAPAPRLTMGGQGRVLPGLPNNLRSQPSTSSTYMGQIPSGGVFSVLEGPRCGGTITWWKVNYNGIIAWTGEGQSGQYWVEPYTTSTCSIALPPRLMVGGVAQVTPGLPNSLRSEPGSTSGVRLGDIPGGASFSVLEGPRCGNNLAWWRVNYNGAVGWTAEGQNGVYWLTPMTCWNSPAFRLAPGMVGRVTPNGIPNTMRSAPGTASNSLRIGSIPSGAQFTVLSGPQCGNDGRSWWQVNYNGMIGWTAEGEGSTYWLEPVY